MAAVSGSSSSSTAGSAKCPAASGTGKIPKNKRHPQCGCGGGGSAGGAEINMEYFLSELSDDETASRLVLESGKEKMSKDKFSQIRRRKKGKGEAAR